MFRFFIVNFSICSAFLDIIYIICPVVDEYKSEGENYSKCEGFNISICNLDFNFLGVIGFKLLLFFLIYSTLFSNIPLRKNCY